MAKRRRHHKAEALSEKAQRLIEEGLAGQATYEDIVTRVKQETGELISTSALHRYHDSKVRPRKEAALAAALIARSVIAENGDVNESELRTALSVQLGRFLLPAIEAIAEDDPRTAAKLYAELEGRRLEERKLAQRNAELELRAQALEQAKKVAEARLAQIQKTLAQADEKKGKRAPTKAELEQTLRDLYGIVSAPPAGGST